MGGMDTNKVLQVIGLSSAVLFDKNEPLNPINRRISIVVMNERAEKAVTMDDQTIDIDMQAEPDSEMLQNP
jgi:chemotaxis protein MotB